MRFMRPTAEFFFLSVSLGKKYLSNLHTIALNNFGSLEIVSEELRIGQIEGMERILFFNGILMFLFVQILTSILT